MQRSYFVAIGQYRVASLLTEQITQLYHVEKRFWQVTIGAAWIGMLIFFVVDILI